VQRCQGGVLLLMLTRSAIAMVLKIQSQLQRCSALGGAAAAKSLFRHRPAVGQKQRNSRFDNSRFFSGDFSKRISNHSS